MPTLGLHMAHHKPGTLPALVPLMAHSWPTHPTQIQTLPTVCPFFNVCPEIVKWAWAGPLCWANFGHGQTLDTHWISTGTN